MAVIEVQSKFNKLNSTKDYPVYDVTFYVDGQQVDSYGVAAAVGSGKKRVTVKRRYG